jgi:hypothetical protein
MPAFGQKMPRWGWGQRAAGLDMQGQKGVAAGSLTWFLYSVGGWRQIMGFGPSNRITGGLHETPRGPFHVRVDHFA